MAFYDKDEWNNLKGAWKKWSDLEAIEREREKCKIPGVIGIFPIPDEINYICKNLKMDN